MSGTDQRRRGGANLDPDAPAIILVGPQMGENIGAAARAMLNCGLSDLRLVAPRDGWPNEQAVASASGAHLVLERARVFDNLEDAVADLQQVYATTARTRDMVKPVVTAGGAGRAIRASAAQGVRSGILFGRERTGLFNEEVTRADTVLTVPLHPGFSSLNLAQAVLLVGHAWYQAVDDTPEHALPIRGRLATAAEVIGFLEHLEGALDHRGFFRTPELKPSMVQNLRNLFQRASLTDQEVRTLHGVVTALGGRRKDQLD